MYWMVNDDVPALLGPMGGDGLWYFIATKVDPALAPSDAEAAELIRRSTGLDIDVEIIGADPWVARRLIADRYRQGSVFLAGDACHLHPPFGGFGMNMGVGDAVDLGWKIAACFEGWGGTDLLDSYERERRPVHERAMDEAVANYAHVGNQLVRPGLEEDGVVGEATRREVGESIVTHKVREIRTLGLVKGYSYAGSAIVVPDGSPPPLESSMAYAPSAHPGSVAPHLWLSDGSSLYDRFGAGFTLLVTEVGHEAAIAAIERAAADVALPLVVVRLVCARVAARYSAPLCLVRPDQHVAWRGTVAGRAVIDAIRGAASARMPFAAGLTQLAGAVS